MPAYLVQIDGRDPVEDEAVTLRLASVDDERVCHLNGETWWPAIARLPRLRYDLVDAAFSGRVETPSDTIAISVDPLPLLPRYALADARVRIWEGEAGDAFGSYTLRVDMIATAQPRISAGIATLPIAVDDRWLDTPLLATYAGTTGAEGEAGLKGTPKPLSIGAPRFAPGRLIDATNQVYQLSNGEIEDVEVAFERVMRFGSAVSNQVSYAALVAATIPAGTWATAKAVGMVRHGAPPVSGGRFTYHVKGDKAGPDGWVRLPGAITKRLALIAGGTGKFSEASLDALDAARPWEISWHIADQITARDAIQRIAASVNAVMGVSWLSKLFVAPLPELPGTASITLDATGASLPAVAKVEQIEMDLPFWRMAIEAERTWDVHALSDVGFTAVLVDRGAYASGETYREGHIVQNQDSSWLYINPTPTSGNAPPTLPTTSNSFWRVMAKVGPTGSTGAAGLNNAVVTLHKRAASSPGSPSGTFSYDFTTGVLSGGTLNGYTQAIPAADGNPLWVIAAAASASTATTNITAASFSAAVIKDGAGLNVATVELFQRAASPPSVPGSTLTYTFLTGVLSGTLGSWSQAMPAYSANPLYKTLAVAISTGATDTIATGEWTAAQIVAQDGAAGAAGNDGSQAWTPVMSSAMTRTGSTFTRDGSSGSGFNRGFASVEKFVGAKIAWKCSQTNRIVAVGLDPSPGTDYDVATIDYALLCYDTGDLYKDLNGTTTLIGTYTTSDVLSVEHVGTQILFKKNGTVLDSASGVSPDLALGADSSFYDGTTFSVNSVSFSGARSAIDALTLTAVPQIIGVPATAGGTPKSTVPGSQVKVFQGTTDVTASASYAITAEDGLTLPAVSSGGAVTHSGMTADSAYVEISVSYNGASGKIRIEWNKQKDGQSGTTAQADDNTISNPAAGPSYGEVARVSFPAGPNGTFNASWETNSSVNTSSASMDGYLEFSLTGSGGWSTISGSSASAASQPPGEVLNMANGAISWSGSGVSLSGSQNVTVREMARRSGSGTLSGTYGNLHAEWRP